MFVSIGTDAEVFVADSHTGEIESSIGLIKGTKEHPQPTENGAIQKDNVLAEFNSIPAYNEREFVSSVKAAMNDLILYLSDYGKEISIRASHIMDDKWLESSEAQKFGCDPDTSVWALDTVHKVNSGMAKNLRTAAAHVHIGIKKVTPKTQIALVQLLDLYMGVPSLFADHDTQRRRLYGQAGHFRHKEYGVEYRVLSNFWLGHQTYIEYVYRAAKTAAQRIGKEANDWAAKNGDILQTTINNRDLEAAKEICDMFYIDPWPTPDKFETVSHTPVKRKLKVKRL